MDLRTIRMDIAPQDAIARDNVSVKVDAVLYFRVLDAKRAVREVENPFYATSQLAQVSRNLANEGKNGKGTAVSTVTKIEKAIRKHGMRLGKVKPRRAVGNIMLCREDFKEKGDTA